MLGDGFDAILDEGHHRCPATHEVAGRELQCDAVEGHDGPHASERTAWTDEPTEPELPRALVERVRDEAQVLAAVFPATAAVASSRPPRRRGELARRRLDRVALYGDPAGPRLLGRAASLSPMNFMLALRDVRKYNCLMTTTNRDVVRAAVDLIVTLGQAIAAAGPAGIPSGHLYAMVVGSVDLDDYTRAVAVLKRTGIVTERGDVLRLAVTR
jgi:hypothetical protein